MHQDLYLSVQLKLTYITREPTSFFYIRYLNSKVALDESSAYIQNIKHNTRKKKIPLKTHNVIKVLKIKGIYVNIRLEYIPVPQTSTPLLCLGTPVGKPYSALSLLLSCETLELLIFFVDVGASRTTNIIFWKRLFYTVKLIC